MVTLSHDAQGALDRYLKQIRATLRGSATVDVSEVERDVRGHIDAELADHPQPVDAVSLRRVLDRLGTPDQWVTDEDIPAWRKVLNRLRSGPEDWRLAYLSFGLFFLGPVLLSRMWLWPLPPLLMVAGFLMARASLALLAEHDEPVGARRWLIYPPLVVSYLGLAIALLAGPLPFLGDAITATAPSNGIAAASIVLALGIWWILLGIAVRRLTTVVHAMFWPFADRFDRRHAVRMAACGALLAVASGVMLATL